MSKGNGTDPFRSTRVAASAYAGAGEAGDPRRARRAGLLLGAGALLALAALTVGTPPARALPGQNGRIVCDGTRGTLPDVSLPQPIGTVLDSSEIFSMNPDGSDQRLLTSNIVLDSDPTVSPDGNTIAFSSERDARPADLYLMNADGTNVRRVARRAAVQTAPSFSPDGRSLVFQDGFGPQGAGSNFEITRMDIDGTNQRALTTEPTDDTRPAWSPDLGTVAWDTHAGSPGGGGNFADCEIFLADAHRGDESVGGPPRRRLTFTRGDPRFPQGGPNAETQQIVRDTQTAFSPDSRQIVFTSTRGTPPDGRRRLAIWKLTIPATAEARPEAEFMRVISDDWLTGRPLRNGHNLAWSPDGTRISFSADVRVLHPNGAYNPTAGPRGEEVEVFTMNAADGGDLRRLTNRPGFDGRCDWGAVPGTNPRSRARPRVSASGVPRACASRTVRVRVRASSASVSALSRVTVSLDGRRIRTTSRGSFTVRVPTRGLRRGTHRLTIVATDAAGNRTRRTFRFRVCAARAPTFTG